MAYPDLLTGNWQDSVRNVCGVSAVDVPNAMLDDDLYGPESEDSVKRLITDWSSLKATKALELRRATVYHIASKVCSYLAKKLSQSETIGDFRFELQKIDWGKEAFKNLEMHYVYIELAKSGTVSYLKVMDISSHYPPIYDEIEVIEE